MLEPLQTEGGKGGAMTWLGEKPMFWSECLKLAVSNRGTAVGHA
jgi:hypothetical protein